MDNNAYISWSQSISYGIHLIRYIIYSSQYPLFAVRMDGYCILSFCLVLLMLVNMNSESIISDHYLLHSTYLNVAVIFLLLNLTMSTGGI